ncbi:MAG: SDR family oxidoreductase [Planctomycetes bacterium]|nr:SDR family oxidoreductase [Planctomycetota bacterium]
MKKEALFNELFDLSGQTALITGGATGLGKVIAETYASAGANIAICSRKGEVAEDTAEEIAGATGAKALGFAMDVRDEKSVNDGIALTQEKLGRIDILLASAGVNVRKDINDFSKTEWDSVIDTNLTGCFLTAKAVIPGMIARNYGRIVFIASIFSYISLPARAAYGASKAGVMGLTRSLALDTVKHNICVNSICPGPFVTEINRALWEDAKVNEEFLKNIPIGRWGELPEIRGLALYLAAPACSFTTGSGMVIDGGWTAK